MGLCKDAQGIWLGLAKGEEEGWFRAIKSKNIIRRTVRRGRIQGRVLCQNAVTYASMKEWKGAMQIGGGVGIGRNRCWGNRSWRRIDVGSHLRCRGNGNRDWRVGEGYVCYFGS